MIIERNDKEILISIPNTKYLELTSQSEATQEEADQLANEVNREWWKKRFLP
jgi:hypothetical protein